MLPNVGFSCQRRSQSCLSSSEVFQDPRSLAPTHPPGIIFRGPLKNLKKKLKIFEIFRLTNYSLPFTLDVRWGGTHFYLGFAPKSKTKKSGRYHSTRVRPQGQNILQPTHPPRVANCKKKSLLLISHEPAAQTLPLWGSHANMHSEQHRSWRRQGEHCHGGPDVGGFQNLTAFKV